MVFKYENEVIFFYYDVLQFFFNQEIKKQNKTILNKRFDKF